MDNATHAFAGLLLADATTGWIERRTGARIDRRLRRIVSGVGIVAAELPDADLLYSGPVVGMGKVGYLLHHRGHTHTVVFAVLAALAIWWAARALRERDPTRPDLASTPLLILAIAGTLSHLLLDYSNSYGVHPFWPLDNRWYYGDAVFIVEPWLWVVAIPPLLFGARRTWSRILLSFLLGAILVAAWTLGELPADLALIVSVFAVVWLVTQRWIPSHRRTMMAISAWLVVELVFATSSARARSFAQEPLEPNEQVVDVVLTPAPANPFCFDALVVARTNDLYRVRSASVAPWASHRDTTRASQRCRRRARTGRFGTLGIALTPDASGNHVHWSEQWSAQRADLRALSDTRCEVSAALRFMRVPIWTSDSAGTVQLFDARFGTGGDGFATVSVSDGPCSLGGRAWVPPWVPPRADVLELRTEN